MLTLATAIPQTRREWVICLVCAAVIAVVCRCSHDPVPSLVGAPSIELRDVPTQQQISIPRAADTVTITRILRVRDSLRKDLASAGVRVIARVDTVIAWAHGADTIRIACDEIQQTADLQIRRAPIPTVAVVHRPAWYGDVSMARTVDQWIPVAAVGAQIPVGSDAIVYCEGVFPIRSTGVIPALRAGMRITL